MKRHLLTTLLALAAAPLLHAAEPTDWYPVKTAHKPFVRWWWPGSAVDREGLTYNLEEFARKGIGGVEITPIYGVRGNEANDIEYLSPAWMEMLRHTLSEGKRLGLQIDMNNGTGWPFGGPEVTTARSARKRIVEQWTLRKGESITDKIRPKDPRQQPFATLERVMAFNGKRRLDLTRRVGPDTLLDWRAPRGEWTVYALFSGRTLQKVKRAAPGGEGLVLNHYDSTALHHYLDRFEWAFDRSGCPWPNTFFNDSFEVYGADWDDRLLAEFERQHGYKLETYLPEFLARDGSEVSVRVVTDYRETLFRMLLDNFTRPWTAWAHAHGARTRNQAHGSPGNILDIYAAVDIPECESFGQTAFDIPGLHREGPSRPSDADPAVLKFASSAAHLTGKPQTSAEALTWLTEHFRTALSLCKPEIDQLFAAGVNHLYFHGAPYSPRGAKFPGWLFYATVNLSPTNSIWHDAEGLFDYVARCQSFLTAGRPDNDFLLYLPLYDIWREQQGKQFLLFDIHKMDRTMPRFKEAVHTILAAGYDADYLSDRYLRTLRIEADGTLCSEGGTRYRALLMPACELIPLESMERLAQLVYEGATVAFIGSVPDDVPGLGALKARRKAFRKLQKRLPALEIGEQAAITPYGKGRFITGRGYAEVLRAVGVQPEPFRITHEGAMIRRTNEAGGKNYFLSLLGGRAIDGWVTLATKAAAVEIFDPVSGASGMALTRPNGNGTTDVRLQLPAGGSVLLKCFPEAPAAPVPAWAYYAQDRENALDLDRNWIVRFLESDPEMGSRGEARSSDTQPAASRPLDEAHAPQTLRRSDRSYIIDRPRSWTELADPVASVNVGTARYSLTFTLRDPAEADDWQLDLGDVRESAVVYVNGQRVAVLWSVPFRIAIGRWLRAGENTLEVDVTNLPANRIADMERQGAEWRIFKDANVVSVTNAKDFDFGTWEVVPSGLNSPVTLTPLKRIDE